MDDTQTQIKFDVDKWKIKVRDRRNNRMRIQINLTKDEALAYKNFAEVCKPLDVSDSIFMKTVFLTGIEAMNKELAKLVQQYAKENKESLAASGITVLEGDDGEVKLADTTVYEHDLSGDASIQQGRMSKEEAQGFTKVKE